MVSKKVLKNIGVFAMTVMLAAAPVLAVSANMGDGTQLLSVGDNGSDPGSDNQPANPGTSAPALSHVSYNVVGGNVSTVDGLYRETTVAGVAVRTSYADVLAAFGAGAGSSVKLAVVDSTHGPAAGVSINDGLARLAGDGVAAVKGAEIDIIAYLNEKSVIDIGGSITITVGIPESFKEAGCDYAVIRVQEGGRVSILTDKDQDAATLTFDTNGFGVFVMVKAPAGSFDKYK